MNRAPSPRDPWWSQHQKSCSGTYEKIKEPENYKQKKKSTKQSKDAKKASDKSMNIKDMFNKNDASTKAGSGVAVSDVKPFEGTGHRLIDHISNAASDDRRSPREKMLLAAEKRQREAQKHGSSSQKRPRGDRKKKASPPSSNSRLKKAQTANEDIRKYCSDNHANSTPAAKKLKLDLDTDNQIIILDSADSPKLQQKTIKSLSNPTSLSESESDVVIDLSEEAGPSSAAVVVLDETKDSVSEVIALDDTADHCETDDNDDQDLVEVESGSGALTVSPGDLDFKTCPVCGMSNIPQAIINAHIAFCLDAEEESQLVDEDNL